MNTEDFLSSAASVGVALAGFVALVSLFRRRGETQQRIVMEGQRVMVELSFSAALFSLIPYPLANIVLPDQLWGWSSAFLLVFLVLWGAYDFRRSRRTARFLWLRQGIFYLLLAFIVAVQLWNILSWHNVAGYMLGLIWMLVAAATQFMLFVYREDRPPTP